VCDEERLLLWAVVRDPEDDTVRLAYADWLDEHTRPARAEFIRLQIEQSKCPSCGGRAWYWLCDGAKDIKHQCDRCRPAFDAQWALWVKYGCAWLTYPRASILGAWDALHPNHGDARISWKRGFVSAVHCRPNQWLAHHDAVLWRPRVECTACDGDGLEHGNKFWNCDRCDGTGRVPDEFKGVEHPVTDVYLLETPVGFNPYYGRNSNTKPWGGVQRYSSVDRFFTTNRWDGVTFHLPERK
jgi:uncharacterized protein (TIGR02996 family)